MRIIIENLNKEYYDLNTSDIWYFERLYFINVEKNIDLGQRIINEIQSLVISNNKPVYEIAIDEGDEEVKRKHSRDRNKIFENLFSPDKMFELEFFFHFNTCYEYYADIIINKDSMEESLFQFFFALKLRQYQFALIQTENFLTHQLKSNFKSRKESYCKFLTILFRQYSAFFSEDLITTLNEYLDDLKVRFPKGISQVRSFLLYGYEKYGEEYFSKNIVEIVESFTKLKDENFVKKDTKLPEFKNIFTLSVISPDKRIRWTGRNVELKWFVQILIDDLEKVKPPVAGRWATTLHCFAKPGGEDFEKEETFRKASNIIDERKKKLKEILLNL
jgi:hypothetical protein